MMKLDSIIQQIKQQGIELVHVVALDRKHCIGKNNQLAWHVPEDLEHFKQLTQQGIVIMGRKTFESIGKALPNRENWVITRNLNWSAEGVHIAHSLEESLEQSLQFARQSLSQGDEAKKIFIIGGGEVFKQTIHFMDRLEITLIQLDVQGDVFYPPIPRQFRVLYFMQGKSKQNQIEYRFETHII